MDLWNKWGCCIWISPEDIYIEHNMKYVVSTSIALSRVVNKFIINIETEKQLKNDDGRKSNKFRQWMQSYSILFIIFNQNNKTNCMVYGLECKIMMK
jgi:hypothetical protein